MCVYIYIYMWLIVALSGGPFPTPFSFYLGQSLKAKLQVCPRLQVCLHRQRVADVCPEPVLRDPGTRTGLLEVLN